MVQIEHNLPLGTLLERFAAYVVEYLKVQAVAHRNSLLRVELEETVQHFEQALVKVLELVLQGILRAPIFLRGAIFGHKVLEILQVAQLRLHVDEAFVLLLQGSQFLKDLGDLILGAVDTFTLIFGI